MDNLQTAALGNFNKDLNVSTSELISAYLMSALSSESVALGGKEDDIKKGKTYPDIYNKAKGYSIAIGRNSQAETYGVSIGEKAYSFNCAFALGADAYASSQGATAIGRYAKATAAGAMQLNGNCNSEGEHIAVNTEKNTLKFYAGGNNNVTIVDKDGKISADYAKSVIGNVIGNVTGNLTGDVTGNCSGSSGSCTGNAETASKLENIRKIGGSDFDGTSDIDLSATSATTAETADTSLSVKVKLLDNTFANMRIEMVTAIPEPPENGVLYFVVS